MTTPTRARTLKPFTPEITELPDRLMAVTSTTGDPNVVGQRAFPALYGAAYGRKFALKKEGIEFKVEARKEQRRLRKLPVAVLGVNLPVQVRPQHVDVIIAAPERVLSELDPDHVVPVVDLSETNVGPGVVSVPVAVRGVDSAIRVLRIEPSEVLIKASK